MIVQASDSQQGWERWIFQCLTCLPNSMLYLRDYGVLKLLVVFLDSFISFIGIGNDTHISIQRLLDPKDPYFLAWCFEQFGFIQTMLLPRLLNNYLIVPEQCWNCTAYNFFELNNYYCIQVGEQMIESMEGYESFSG